MIRTKSDFARKKENVVWNNNIFDDDDYEEEEEIDESTLNEENKSEQKSETKRKENFNSDFICWRNPMTSVLLSDIRGKVQNPEEPFPFINNIHIKTREKDDNQGKRERGKEGVNRDLLNMPISTYEKDIDLRDEQVDMRYCSKIGGLPTPIMNPTLVMIGPRALEKSENDNCDIQDQDQSQEQEQGQGRMQEQEQEGEEEKGQEEGQGKVHREGKREGKGKRLLSSLKTVSDLLSPSCDICKAPLFLVTQYYTPTNLLHRIIYVYGCNNYDCQNNNGSWKVIRLQEGNTEDKMERKNEIDIVDDTIEIQHQVDMEINIKERDGQSFSLENKKDKLLSSSNSNSNNWGRENQEVNEWSSSDWGASDWDDFNPNIFKLSLQSSQPTNNVKNIESKTGDLDDLEGLLKTRDDQLNILHDARHTATINRRSDSQEKENRSSQTKNEKKKERHSSSSSEIDIAILNDKKSQYKRYFQEVMREIEETLLQKQREYTKSFLSTIITFPCFTLGHFTEELTEASIMNNNNHKKNSVDAHSSNNNTEMKERKENINKNTNINDVVEQFMRYIAEEGLQEDPSFHAAMAADPTYQKAMSLLRDQANQATAKKKKSSSTSSRNDRSSNKNKLTSYSKRTLETNDNNNGIQEGEEEEYEAVAPRIQAFQRFQQRVNFYPSQVLRYAYGGDPLWSTSRPPIYDYDHESTKIKQRDANASRAKTKIKVTSTSQHSQDKQRQQYPQRLQRKSIPCCEGCGAERKFEFQIMPSILTYLQADEHLLPSPQPTNVSPDEGKAPKDNNSKVKWKGEKGKTTLDMWSVGMEWSVVTVWSCEVSCDHSNREFILVEKEEDEDDDSLSLINN